VPYVFAGADSSLVSLGSAPPSIGTLEFVLGVLAQADITNPSAKDRANDIAITANTKEALSVDKRTSSGADAIHARTNEEVVTLTSDVASQATAEHAHTIAARLLAVRDVVNDPAQGFR
jgi:osmotically-inducible protein OsmY